MGKIVIRESDPFVAESNPNDCSCFVPRDIYPTSTKFVTFYGTNGKTQTATIEFYSADDEDKEICAYIPSWMIKELGAKEGDTVNSDALKSLPLAKELKLRAYSMHFYDDEATAEVLFSQLTTGIRVLTEGTSFGVRSNGELYMIEVVSLKPNKICSFESIGSTISDIDIEFLEPLDYKK